MIKKIILCLCLLTAMLTIFACNDTHLVTFNTDGGSAVPAQTIIDGGFVTKPSDPIKTGYTFINWFHENTFETVFSFETDVVTKNLTIYAKFVQSFTVTFLDENGNHFLLVYDVLINTVVDEIIPPNYPSKAGYTFVGWDNFISGSLVQSNLVFTPIFEETVIETFLVIFYDEHGDILLETIVDINTVITNELLPPTPTKFGYSFIGWDGLTIGMHVNSHLEFHPLFEQNPDYHFTLTFMLDESTTYIIVDNVLMGLNINEFLPDDPYKDGYLFKGWSGIPSDNLVTSDLILTAIFEQEVIIQMFTVSFLNYDDSVFYQVTVEANTLVNRILPTSNPIHPHFMFSFWLGVSLTTRVTSDMNIRPLWDGIYHFNVTFLMDDGSVLSVVRAEEGSMVINLLITPPYKAGYSFGGWEGFDVNLVLTQDITLTAIFMEDGELFGDFFTGSLMSIDFNTMRLEVPFMPYTSFTNFTRVQRLLDSNLIAASLNDLFVGMDNLYFHVIEGVVMSIIIDGPRVFSNMRVAIRHRIDDLTVGATLFHDSVTLVSPAAGEIRTFCGTSRVLFPANSTLVVTNTSTEIIVTRAGSIVFRSNKRVVIDANVVNSATEVRITSITRAQGNPSYAGNLEFIVVNNRILMINDIDIEEYLTKVVPSEMPASWNLVALEVQAVAARTYAIRDMLNATRAIMAQGWVVDDSISTQVYNNIAAQPRSTQAVMNTAGLVMMNNNRPINAFFYSTTSGLTASSHEVWFSGMTLGTVDPALLGQNVTNVPVDTSSEADMLRFFQTISMQSTGGASLSHRWHVGMTFEQLTNSLRINMPIQRNNSPANILTQVNGQGSFIQRAITAQDIGNVTNVSVHNRGESGVVTHLLIETTTHNFMLCNQFTIRFTIRPRDSQVTIDGTGGFSVTNPAHIILNRWNAQGTRGQNEGVMQMNLMSGFFSIVINGNMVNFYGGGNGHGVGLCQFSANALAPTHTVKEILTKFYSNIEIPNLSSNFVPRPDWQNLF